MTLMTWCGVRAIGWVAIACTGAILSESHTARGIRDTTLPVFT
jgi:hypothetical protein